MATVVLEEAKLDLPRAPHRLPMFKPIAIAMFKLVNSNTVTFHQVQTGDEYPATPSQTKSPDLLGPRGRRACPSSMGAFLQALRQFLLPILALSLLSLYTSTTNAATYFVAPTGSDANAGTQSQPLATLSQAFSKVAPGDTIQIAAGTYSGETISSTSGSSIAHISVQGAGIGKTVITSKVTIRSDYYEISGITFRGSYVQLDGCSHVTIDSCETSRGSRGISFANGPSYCVVRNSDLHHPTGTFGMIELGGHDNIIEKNLIHDSAGNDAMRANGAYRNLIRNNSFVRIVSPSGAGYNTSSSTSSSVGTGTKSFAVPAGLSFAPDDNIIITSSANSAVTMTGFVSNYTGTTLRVEIVAVTGNGTFADWNVTLASAGNHADIVQAFTYDSYENVFDGNRIENCSSQLGNVEQNANPNVRDWTFRNNLFINSRIQINVYAPGFKFYNNTIYNTDGTTGFRGATATKGNGNPVLVFNNIFCRVGSIESAGPYSGALADYNLITDYDDSAKTGYSEAHGINGGYTPNQIFVDPANGDFRLKTGSPAIGKGTDLSQTGFNYDKNGSLRSALWDMGAFQSGSANPVPAPTVNCSITPSTISPGQQATLNWSSANATSVSVTDLGNVSISGTAVVTPTATTTYIVTATGLGGVASTNVVLVVSDVEMPTAGDGTWIEAESGIILAPFVSTNGVVVQDIQTATLTGSGRLSLHFNVMEAGEYAVIASVDAPTDGSNSVYFNIDGEPTDPEGVWDIPITTGLQNQVGCWRGNGTFDHSEFVPKIFSLSSGVHELIIRGREAKVRLDKVMIAKKPRSTEGVALSGGN